MNGDFTRFPIGRVADSLYPLAQQGRVHLDSDWNELAATLTDTARLSIDALLGGSAAIDTGFKPDGAADETLAFLPGTYFVDGYRVSAPDKVRLGEQPWQPPGDVELPAATVDAPNALFYLDVWIRHVSAQSLPNLAEVALRGPDTTTRGVLTWQVRATRVDQATADDIRKNWAAVGNKIYLKDRAKMLAWVELTETLEPCLDDVVGGYTGPRNQLYRIEVAPAELVEGGDPKARALLWSRDNASVESRIRSSSGGSVELISDPTMPALSPGAIVQLVDDAVELGGSPHPPVRVASADPDEDRVTLSGPDLNLQDAAGTHARLRHWDGILPLSEGEEQEVEYGLRIEVKDAAQALVGDYWVIPARTNGDLLWPDERRWPQPWPESAAWPDKFRPPHGVDHMLAPLALIVGPAVLDCRWTVVSMRKPKT